MNDENSKQRDSTIKPSRLRYIIAAGMFVLLIFAAVVLMYSTQFEQESDQLSEKVILQAAARSLSLNSIYFEQGNLTDEDFAKIIYLRVHPSELNFLNNNRNVKPGSSSGPLEFTDIKMLEKFTNLRELELTVIYYPQNKIPQWMRALENLGISNFKNRYSIDLKPLENLINLRKLDLSQSDFRNIEPLANLQNLEELNLTKTKVSNIKPLRKLKNLKRLYLRRCEDISDEQVEDLLKALPELKIIR